MTLVKTDESPELLFLKELETALAKERLKLSDDAYMYISGLLAHVKIRKDPHPSDALAPALLGALQHDPGELRNQLLRRVGNSALLLCGLWWQSVEHDATFRHGADRAYQEDIGRNAFRNIGSELYQELADKFIGVVDVFAHIGEQIGPQDAVHQLALYELFLRTNNRRAEKILIAQGLIVPNHPGQTH